jgi:hypothetical protein
MPFRTAVAALAGTVLLCSGCGTLFNYVGSDSSPKAFGGIAYDIDRFGKILDGSARGSGTGPVETNGSSGGSAFAAALMLGIAFWPVVDFPLSRCRHFHVPARQVA